MKKCLVIGAAMLDIVVQMDRLPKSGEDVYMKSQEMTVGGCAYNVADILKHFQIPYTLFAPVGTGVYGEMIRKELKKNGHTSTIQASIDNGYCMCIVEADGERTFMTLPGAECRFEREWFEELRPEEYDAVYVCGYEIEGEGGEAIVEFLEGHPEMTVYYAPGPRITYIAEEKQKRLFALHPILHLNDKEALDYTGADTIQEAAEKLYEKVRNTVMITLGASGVYLKGKEAKRIPAEKATVVDTIGAGDSHIGSVIAMRQRKSGFEEAIRTANKVAALVVGVQGPTLTEEQFRLGGF